MDPRPDDERLAALLEGRLSGPERDELLAHLAAHDEDYDVFVETAEILREAEEEAPEEVGHPRRAGAVPLPPPGPGRRRWLRRAPRWIALAAVLAGLGVAAVFATRGGEAAGDPVRLAARMGDPGQGLPEGWTEQRPWTTTRGETARGRAGGAVRAGALLVDLAVAVEARDSADTWLLATQLRQRFDPQATASSPLSRIAARAGEPSDTLRPLARDATARLEARLGRDPLRVGAWTEAARLAAERRDEPFFRAASTDRMLRRAERLAPGGAASRVRALTAAEGPRDWDALADALGVLLGELAA